MNFNMKLDSFFRYAGASCSLSRSDFEKYAPYCNKNGIYIYPIPLVSNGHVCRIVVNVNGSEKSGNEKYVGVYNPKTRVLNHDSMNQKIKELYKKFYFQLKEKI